MPHSVFAAGRTALITGGASGVGFGKLFDTLVLLCAVNTRFEYKKTSP